MSIKHVLIVEDEPFIIDIYTETLQEEGLTVQTAKNGQEALDILEKGRRFDVILLDIMMPRLSGLDLLQALQNKHELKDNNIILLTNLPDKAILDHCYKLGALGTIMKSDITPGELLPKITEILKTHTKVTS